MKELQSFTHAQVFLEALKVTLNRKRKGFSGWSFLTKTDFNMILEASRKISTENKGNQRHITKFVTASDPINS